MKANMAFLLKNMVHGETRVDMKTDTIDVDTAGNPDEPILEGNQNPVSNPNAAKHDQVFQSMVDHIIKLKNI